MVFAIAIFAPALHGVIGPLDELELCIAPFVIMITVLLLRVFSERSHQQRNRTRPGNNRAAKRKVR